MPSKLAHTISDDIGRTFYIRNGKQVTSSPGYGLEVTRIKLIPEGTVSWKIKRTVETDNGKKDYLLFLSDEGMTVLTEIHKELQDSA